MLDMLVAFDIAARFEHDSEETHPVTPEGRTSLTHHICDTSTLARLVLTVEFPIQRRDFQILFGAA